jgi:hypothetical protein
MGQGGRRSAGIHPQRLPGQAMAGGGENEAAHEGSPQAHEQADAVATAQGRHQQSPGQPAQGSQGQRRQDAASSAEDGARQPAHGSQRRPKDEHEGQRQDFEVHALEGGGRDGVAASAVSPRTIGSQVGSQRAAW